MPSLTNLYLWQISSQRYEYLGKSAAKYKYLYDVLAWFPLMYCIVYMCYHPHRLLTYRQAFKVQSRSGFNDGHLGMSSNEIYG